LTLSGGTLSAGLIGGNNGSGTISIPVTSNSAGSVIAPGAALTSGYGTLTINSTLTTNADSTLLYNLNVTSPITTDPNNGYPIYGGDLINLGSTLNLAGTGTIALTAATQAALNGNGTGDYRLFGALSGSSTSFGLSVSDSGLTSYFTLPVSSGSNSFSLSSTVDNGFIDLVLAHVSPPGPPTWSTSSGNWSNAGNWTSYPTSGGTAVLGQSFTGSATVTLDTAATLGVLQFQGSSASYTIQGSGSGALTMYNNGGTALVIVNSGSHAINNAPVTLAASLDVQTSLTSGGTLTIGGNINDNGAALSLELDGPGELILSGSNSYGEATGWTYVNPSDGQNGMLVIAPARPCPPGRT